MNVIEARNISKSYKEKVIFQNLSFVVNEGEIVGIIGDSGKGKTTLLNCLGQLDEIDAGEIFIYGNKINKQQRKKYFKEVFGFLFQNFALIDNETVFKNLNFISKDRQLITQYLEDFGLGKDCLNKYIFQLSGGEQQLISLIRMLLKCPKIIFADEPTASLDEENGLFVIKALQGLRDKGVAIIIVTHDKHLLQYFDRIIDLNHIE